MLEQINFWDCECKFCNDLKVARYLCGMMQGQPMYPCPYCEVHKDNLDSEGPLRTIKGSMFEHTGTWKTKVDHGGPFKTIGGHMAFQKSLGF